MKIFITKPAMNRLIEIEKYYKKAVSDKIAKKIINEIISSIKSLSIYPEKGQIEPTLQVLKLGHRRIIAGNYKIIYRLEKNIIFITDVFDSRRNPVDIQIS